MSDKIQNFSFENSSGICGKHAETQDTDEPIIFFIHGNSASSAHWKEHVEYFVENGYPTDKLWAVDIPDEDLTHEGFESEIDDFVSEVKNYTNTEECCIVAHSLGVTSARYWMENKDMYESVEAFIGIAGANHGISACPPSFLCTCLPNSSFLKPCQRLSRVGFGKSRIERFNEKVGETPGDVDYFTVRGLEDKIFRLDPDSPKLEGANRNVAMDAGHIEVKNQSIELIYKWCLNARD